MTKRQKAKAREQKAREIMRRAFQDVRLLGLHPELEFGCKVSHVTNPSEHDFEFVDLEHDNHSLD